MSTKNEHPGYNKEGRSTGAQIGKLLIKIAKESERAAVILGVAQIDICLKRCLKNLLHNNPGGNDNLFDGDRPLSTFSSKILLTYRLGVIDNDFESSLQILRKIRNDFAHSIEDETLEMAKNKNRIREIMKRIPDSKFTQDINESLKKIDVTQEVKDFCFVLTILIAHLEFSTLANDRIEIKHVIGFENF